MNTEDRNIKTRFEELEVWQSAHTFVLEVYKLTKDFPEDERYSLISQLRRSASSVPTNIVEGNERQSKKEFIQFLYTAKASLAESHYQLILSRDLDYISEEKLDKLRPQIIEIGKMINGLIRYLKHG